MKLDIDNPSKNFTQGRHLAETIAGERFLTPFFGVPVELLYSLGIPEIAMERMRLALGELEIKAVPSIVSYAGGKLTIKVEFETGETVEAAING